jgi:hypothetical protein
MQIKDKEARTVIYRPTVLAPQRGGLLKRNARVYFCVREARD